MQSYVLVPHNMLQTLASMNCDHVIRGERSCDDADIERGGCCNACWARRAAQQTLVAAEGRPSVRVADKEKLLKIADIPGDWRVLLETDESYHLAVSKGSNTREVVPMPVEDPNEVSPPLSSQIMYGAPFE